MRQVSYVKRYNLPTHRLNQAEILRNSSIDDTDSDETWKKKNFLFQLKLRRENDEGTVMIPRPSLGASQKHPSTFELL